MSASVQRLEALLQRVQHNRKLPRAAAPASGGVVHTAVGNPAPAPARAMSVAAAPQGQAASMAARPVRERTSTPLEMAVEGELNRPGVTQAEAPAAPVRSVMQEPRRAPAQEVPRRVQEPLAPTPQPMPRVSVPQRQPVQAASPTRIESSSIAPPSRPIANVVSKHPSTDPASFGQLLARSLRLRPR
jgi:hypothetical protein